MLNYSRAVIHVRVGVCNLGELQVFKGRPTTASDTSPYTYTHIQTSWVCFSCADVTVRSADVYERLPVNNMFAPHMFASPLIVVRKHWGSRALHFIFPDFFLCRGKSLSLIRSKRPHGCWNWLNTILLCFEGFEVQNFAWKPLFSPH